MATLPRNVVTYVIPVQSEKGSNIWQSGQARPGLGFFAFGLNKKKVKTYYWQGPTWLYLLEVVSDRSRAGPGLKPIRAAAHLKHNSAGIRKLYPLIPSKSPLSSDNKLTIYKTIIRLILSAGRYTRIRELHANANIEEISEYVDIIISTKFYTKSI